MSERPRYAWSNCCVPGCARRSRLFPPGEEWLCGPHWRSVPRAVRGLFALYRARSRRGMRWTRRRRNGWDLAWRKTKRIAIQRAAGL